MKKIASLLLALVMCLTLGVSAFAQETDPYAFLYDETMYDQTLISEEPVVMDGVVVGTHELYVFRPKVQPFGTTNSCWPVHTFTDNGGNSYSQYSYVIYDQITATATEYYGQANGKSNVISEETYVTDNGTWEVSIHSNVTFKTIFDYVRIHILTKCDADGNIYKSKIY